MVRTLLMVGSLLPLGFVSFPAGETYRRCGAKAPDPAGTVWVCAQRGHRESGDDTCATRGSQYNAVTVDVWEYELTNTYAQFWRGYHCANFGGWGYHSDRQRVLVYHPTIGEAWVGYYAYEWIGGGGQCAFFVYHYGAAGYLYEEFPCVAGPVEPWPFALPV